MCPWVGMGVWVAGRARTRTERYRVTVTEESPESGGSWAGAVLTAEEASVPIPEVEAMH